MPKSPQFKEAILHNLDRINSIKIDVQHGGTLYAMYLKDYAKRGYLKQHKSPNIFSSFFLQKVF